MRYRVEVTETLQRVIEIEADNADDALAIINKKYREEEIVLDSDDYINAEIEIL